MMKVTGILFLFLGANSAVGFGEEPAVTPTGEVEREKWTYKGEFFASLGWGSFWHGDDSLGSGMELGGGVGFRPFRSKLAGLGFEVQVRRLLHQQQRSNRHSTDGTALTLFGNVLYHFSDSTVAPYVVGGIGVLKADYIQKGYSEWYDLPGGRYHEEYWSRRIDASKVAINFGAGIKIALTRELSLRPEVIVIDTTPGSGYNWGSPRLSLAVGYHW